MMIKINIDGKEYEVKEGRNLLEVCLSLGFDLPYFCYHPAMGSVGACRQCAVKRFKDANDKKGKIIMSCLEPVSDGMIISIEDPEAKTFRKQIIESLMLNHPHDCPVCDEGGECHLQDMTVMTGHNYRRTDFKKRTFKNQYLGPFINHEMNRCIECYRCVRFYKDYAGGKDFDVFGSHDHVYFGRAEEGILESEFSGNLVEVCPTGVFTDKTLREHYTRKWDLTNSPSVCVNCSVGCNIIVGERYNKVRRIMSRYHGSVNGYFICDRGRFGYDFIHSDKRITKPYIRTNGSLPPEETDTDRIMSEITMKFSEGRKIIGIGSPKASLEANYCLRRLVGKDNFYQGVPAKEHDLIRRALGIFKNLNIHSPALKEIEKSDAVFILGEDITASAPMMALAVRQAARTVPVANAVKSGIPQWHDDALRNATIGQNSPIFIACSGSTKLDELAQEVWHGDPAKLGSAVMAAIEGESSSYDDETNKLASSVAEALLKANSPLIITGTNSENPDVMDQAEKLLQALTAKGKEPMLAFVVSECNNTGLAMMNARSWEEIKDEDITVIVLENDIFKEKSEAEIGKFRKSCREIIVMDHTFNSTTEKADMIIPVGTFAEAEGTLVNYEGRAQRYYRVLPHEHSMPESWRWLKGIMALNGDSQAAEWQSIDDIILAMAEDIPDFSPLKKQGAGGDFFMLNEKIRRQTPRFTGRTAITANINVSEPKPPVDTDSPMVFSMEGTSQDPPSLFVPYYWTPGWNSVQSMNFYLDEPNGHLKGGDPGIRLINEE